MATRGKERLIPMKIIGDLDDDLDNLIGEGWGDGKTGKGTRKSLIVTHEDGSTEHVLEDVSKSSWRRETCPTSPPLLISTLPNSPNPSSPVPQPKPPQFIPGHVISEPSTPTKLSASGHVERGQTVHATPILIQREQGPSVETEDEDDDDDTEAEDGEEEDIYSPGTVSLPNLSPISSATSSPHRGLSPDPSYTSWTPADEETIQDMSEGKGDEEVGWDTLEDASTPPPSLNYRVHIEVEGEEDRISGVEKGKQSYNIKGQQPLSLGPSIPSERLEKPPSCQSKPPPASRIRHPVRIVPISLHTEQVHSSPDPARESQTKESEVVNVEGEGNTNVFRRGSSFTQNKRRSESSGDAATRADIPPSHHKRASSLDAAAERKVWSIPINIQARQASAESQGAKREGLVDSGVPTKMGSGAKIPTERCDRAAQGEDRVGQPQREKENTTHRRPSGGDQPRKISVPVRLMSEERELGSLLVHQSSEERLWGVKVPEQIQQFDADCTPEDCMDQSQQGTSKKEERATKDDSGMFTNASNLPFGPTYKPPTSSGGKPLTIDPFAHTHLPFSLPTGLSCPPSPVRSVPIHREEEGQRDNVQKDTDRHRNFSGPEQLNKLHDGLEEARGKLSAQAKKLLDRQEKVEDSLRRGKESRSREQESRPREQERGRKGRPEPRSQSSDPANRNPEESNRPRAKRRERSLEEIDRDIATIWKELQELDSSAPPLPPRLAGAASSPSPRKASTDRSPASRHFSFPPRVSPGTQPGSITPSYSTPSASPASSRAFPPRRAGSASRSRRASTPASPLLYGEETCHQSENRGGLDTVTAVGDEGYAKRAGTPSAAGNAPYWAEGSPMNRGSGIQQEENKLRGSKRQEDHTKLSNSSDQKTGKSSRRDEETGSSRYGRSSSREDEAKRPGGEKSTERRDSWHRSGPVTRIVPIHMEGEEKPAAKTHQVPIKITDRRGRSESRGRRDNSKGQVPVKVTYMEANANMQSKAFMDSNENCDAFTQTFQGDKRNNCVLS